MKKVVIHTMVGKEDGERRRWKGKPGIKESLRAGSSVLTLSCSVDITDNSRRRPRQHRPTRGSFLFFFFWRRKRDERWVARRPGSWSTFALFLVFIVRSSSPWTFVEVRSGCWRDTVSTLFETGLDYVGGYIYIL